jgi:branched-chain amino acid aminotransferase
VLISIDGEIVAPEQATISVLDRGLLYGDGCFEVLRTWSGVARDLEAHLDRLAGTAAFLRLPCHRDVIRAEVERALAAAHVSPIDDRRVRIILTRGPGGLAAPMASAGPGRRIVIVEPVGELPREVTLALVDWPLPARRTRGHKTLAYLDHLIARELARDVGADDAIRTDANGAIAEGGTCNVFAVSEGAVHTPAVDDGVLPGIVRGHVLALCEELGIPLRVRPLDVAEVREADEVFVTSSVRGVTPVVKVDQRALAPGPITARIATEFLHHVSNPRAR